MATEHHNLSYFNEKDVPNGAEFKIGIVVSEWNSEITLNLLQGAKSSLIECGVLESNILIHFVPGTFELALGSQFLFENTNVDGLIAIGVVIQGETRHFDFVCQATSQGLMDVQLRTGKPLGFGVLTVSSLDQALARSNKGAEAAQAAVFMALLQTTV
jgi:6,7-dimethyl-8-ribityllumazine synthase